jgi:hypothetical protein
MRQRVQRLQQAASQNSGWDSAEARIVTAGSSDGPAGERQEYRRLMTVVRVRK